MSFSIITDSSANLTNKQISKKDVKIVSLSYIVGEKEYLSYIPKKETDYKSFYDLLRAKEHIKTSLVSYERVEEAVKDEFEKGKDVLYISFASSLSGSYNIVDRCLSDLKEQYPERQAVLVDSLCASMGQGLYVCLASDKRAKGASLSETAKYLEDIKMNIVHLFTVDDLFYLKRGGRLSGATAVVGTILGIKPLLHMNNEGKLVPYGKTRGRKNAINELIKRMGETGIELNTQDVFVAHADCSEDAEYAAEQIKKLYNVKSVTINYIDQVIGSHSGPGTLAIFFVGTER